MVGRIQDDRYWMRRAVEVGSRGDYRVRPNPRVGCVIVAQGVEVGAGHHAQVGGPHAEVVALRAAGAAARGATAYVTLEPCNHVGRTPPCSLALVQAGIARVVVGTLDPHPKAGGGVMHLRSCGLDVAVDVEQLACRRLAEVFMTNVQKGRAFVQLKLAATLDGKVAAADGTNRWVTGPEARKRVHHFRAEADAILIGSGTALADDPRLDVRLARAGQRQPVRVVLDRRGRLQSAQLQLADTDRQATTVYTEHPQRLALLQARGVQVRHFPGPSLPDQSTAGLTAVLADLWAQGVCHVLCEGGPTLATALLRAGLVDRLDWMMAPKLLGVGTPAVGELGVHTMESAVQLRLDELHRAADDVWAVYRPEPST